MLGSCAVLISCFVTTPDGLCADVAVQLLQPAMDERSPTNLKFYTAATGGEALAYKLTDSESPGDIMHSQLLNGQWSAPGAINLLRQNNHQLVDVVAMSKQSDMMILQGDDTDYAKVFGLTASPPGTTNETDPIIPNVDNTTLITLLENNQRLFFSFYVNQRWSQPQPIVGTQRSMNAKVAAGANNTALVVYSVDTDKNEATPGDSELYYSFFNGTTWRMPSRLTTNSRFEYNLKVLFNSDQFVVTWMQDEDGNPQTTNDSRMMFSQINLSGASTGVPAPIQTQTNPFAGYLLGKANGTAFIFWSQADVDQTAQLYFAQYNGSLWSAPQPTGLSTPDFKNGLLTSVADTTVLIYQDGRQLVLVIRTTAGWERVATIDTLEQHSIDLTEVSYAVINSRLWIAYAGKPTAATEASALKMGDGLFISSYPLAADLVVADVLLENKRLRLGVAESLYALVENKGLIDSSAFDLELRMDGELIHTFNVQALPPGAEIQLRHTVTPRAAVSRVQAEIIPVVQDADQINNRFTKPIHVHPDYLVKSVRLIDATRIGIDVRERKNIAATSVVVKAYLESNGVQTEIGAATYASSSLEPIIIQSNQISGMSLGDKIVAKVNPTGEVIEDDYANNFAVYSHKVIEQADYQIKRLQVTDTTVTVEIKNTGTTVANTVAVLVTDDPAQVAATAPLASPWYFQQVTLDGQGVGVVTLPRSSLPAIAGQYIYATVNPYGAITESDRNNNSAKTLVVPSSSMTTGTVRLAVQDQSFACSNFRFSLVNSGDIPAKEIQVSLQNDAGFIIASNQIAYLVPREAQTMVFHNIPLGDHTLLGSHFVAGNQETLLKEAISFATTNCSNDPITYDIASQALRAMGQDSITGDYLFDLDLQALGYQVDYRKPLIRVPLQLMIFAGAQKIDMLHRVFYVSPEAQPTTLRLRVPATVIAKLPAAATRFTLEISVFAQNNETVTTNNTIALDVNVVP